MAAYIEERELDLTKTPGRTGRIEPITLRRGEDGATELRASLKDKGNAFSAVGYSVLFKVLLPDGNFAITPATVSGSTVSVTINNSVTSVIGNVRVAYFELTKSGVILTTDAVPLIVLQDVDLDVGHEGDYRNVIDQLMEALEAAIGRANNAAQNADEAASAAKQTADDAAADAKKTAQDAADEVKRRADEGEFDGATFTPSVDNGWLTWTNDKGRDNPDRSYIRGPQGYGLNPPAGHYDTESQFQEEHSQGQPGDSFVVGNDLYVWIEDDGWTNVGPFGATVGDVTAKVKYDDADTRVEVIESGPEHRKNLEFIFYNLSGGTGGLVVLSMAVRITSTPADGKAYKAGEVVRFSVDFDNSGLVLLRDMLVNVMPGQLDGGNDISLNPGDKRALTGNYTVTEGDYGTELYISASAANEIMSKHAQSELIPLPSPNPHLSVNTAISNTGTGLSGAYTTGDNITWTVTVTNDGNTTLNDIDVSASIGTIKEV